MSRTTAKHVVLTVGILLSFAAACANKYFYAPSRRVHTTPNSYGLNYEEVLFSSKDGTRLTGWFILAPSHTQSAGTVIHLHGNAHNMSAHFPHVSWLPEEGFNLLVFDYRGYGQSEGRPSRKGVYQDSLAAIRYAKSRSDVDSEKLLLLGQSLGGVNAIVVVGNNDIEGIRAIAVDSPFSSYRLIARDKLRDIPVLSLVRWPLSFVLVTNSYSPDKFVHKISPIPMLFFHGTADKIVPAYHSRLLFARANKPKELLIIENGQHADTFAEHQQENREKLVRFFKQALQPPTTK